MDIIECHKKIPLKWLLGMTAAIFFGILFVGLNPKDTNLPNHASWLMKPAGIQFGEYALAHTDGLSELVENDVFEKKEFSIEIALKLKSYDQEGFKFILLFHSGQDRKQLLIAQWGSSIILMNGDDYNHKRRTKRLAINTSSEQSVTHFVTISTGRDGTFVYFDGRLVGKRKDLTLEIPQGKNTQLILANSVYGRHPWQGDIYGLALYGHTLCAKDARGHFKEWSKKSHFSFAQQYHPIVLFYFDEKEGTRAIDHGRAGHHLLIPENLKVLKPEFFFQRFNEPSFSEGFLKDTFLNFFGFLPFGMVLAALFIRFGGAYETWGVLMTLATGFATSLFIEIVQAWMPTRSSDVLDIILNTLGAMAGAIICRYLVKVWIRETHVA